MSNQPLRVLVVDDSRMVRRVIRTELEEGGYEVVEAKDGLAGLERAVADPQPDLITLDIEMPELDGFETLRRLREPELAGRFVHLEHGRLPVILVTACDSIEVRQKGFELAATDFIAKPFEAGDVLAAVDAVLRPRRRLAGLTALVAEDNAVARHIVVECLEREGIQVIQAQDGGRAFEILCNRMAGVDLVVTDLMMPRLDGKTLCRWIRKVLGLRDIPVIVLTALSGREQLLDAFRAGATDYLVKPFVKEELLARITVHLARTSMGRRLRETVVELKESNRTKDGILAVCSHDMRSPLNGILGFARLLLGRDTLEPEDRESLEQIERSGEHLLDLVNDILELGRLEVRADELTLEAVSLSEVGEASVSALGYLADDKQQQLVLVRSEAEDAIVGNRRALVRAVNNVLSNAIKFTPEDGRIELAIEPGTEGQVALVVTDTGIGIPAEKLPQLFERFSRSSCAGTRGEQSTGLGMSIVKQIAEAHGGSVEVTSEEGRGTTVRMFLPCVPLEDDADLQPARTTTRLPSLAPSPAPTFPAPPSTSCWRTTTAPAACWPRGS